LKMRVKLRNFDLELMVEFRHQRLHLIITVM